MAIRFVDVEPEAGGNESGSKPAQAATARPAPSASPEPAALPDLPLAKPEPKPRGRKKPASTATREGKTESANPAEAFLPGLQVHAKPTPKPRGRKKAFG